MHITSLRTWHPHAHAAFIFATSFFILAHTVLAEAVEKRIPVILDTDIGDDIDDMWALALLLKCPELDVRLIVTDNGKGLYRAKLVGKFLEEAERTDIPIGIGHGGREGKGLQQQWVDEYELTSYPGRVHEDGAQAVIDVINNSEEPITIIAIGPVPNLAEVLQRDPSIAKKACFVGMHGAVRRGYDNSPEVVPEYNVKENVAACQAVFTAPWEMTITPLDTCGLVVLGDENFAKIRDSEDPLLKALIENYYQWVDGATWFTEPEGGRETQSSTLFDTVAVYLAIRDELCKMEQLPIRVNDEGITVVDQDAKHMEVATEWKDLPGFEDWLVERLTKSQKE